jgi:hypothetical protein
VEQNEMKPADGGNDLQQETDGHSEREPHLETAAGGPTEQRKPEQKPCQCRHEAKQLFWTRWSAVAQTIFSALLVAVGCGQIYVYTKQAETMGKQLGEMTQARGDAEAEQRPLLEVRNPEMTPYDANGIWIKKEKPGVAGWLVSPGWNNVGLSPAQHVRMGFDLIPFPEDGPQPVEQLIKLCPPGGSLAGHPEFPGFTVAPGEQHGIIAPAKKMPLVGAVAAQHNRAVIIFVINATYEDGFKGSPIHHSYACVGIFVNNPKKSAFSFVNLKVEGD